MENNIRILLVEDDEDDYILTRDLLAEACIGAYTLDWEQSFASACDRISAGCHDLYLFDYRLGECTGLDLLRFSRQRGCQAPIILLTGQGDREIDMQAMQAGASDFLVKGRIDAQLLERSVRYALERKRVENTLRTLTRKLENKNEELESANKSLKTAQTQVLQQEKMASIGQLAAGVAHEINNPIGFIASNLASLHKYIDKLVDFIAVQDENISKFSTEESKREVAEKRGRIKVDYIIKDISALIEESLDGTERVRKIVQNLKSFSRLDEAEEKMADINAGLESTINIVWNELKYKAALIKQFGEIPEIICNLGQLNQVFMNMLVNAAHSIEKTGEITITTRNDADFIFVTIADTGCGIPENILERIFEPFFTTKEAGKGTGLGLSIAYDIVKRHNGEIMVESAAGKGTSFTIKLPIVKQ